MKNIIVCKNCNEENPFYGLICKNCNSYLRERIFNIDLWKVIGLLIESPRKGFEIIIQSEHKNFLLTIFIFASIKLFIDSMFLSLITHKYEPAFDNFIISFLIIAASLAFFLIFISIILTFTNTMAGLKTRFRDNISILVFSLLPHVFGLIILFIVELTIFGGTLFSKNPSPFTIKEGLAYTLTVFEFLVVIWGIFLSISAVKTQSRNLVYSIIAGLVFNALIYFVIYSNSFYLYN